MPQPKKRTKNASAMKMVGQLLANYRRAAGYTQRSLARLVCAEEETVASIEQGRRALKSDLAEQLDELLDTKGALAVAVKHMPEMDKYPLWAEEFIDREQEAIVISSYENQVIPGLLQTERYATAVFTSRMPRFHEDEVAQKVAGRMERQGILLQRKVPPTSSFILSEGLVRTRLGGREVWREQLQHVLECALVPGIAVQIMPFDRPTHGSLTGPFVLLETPDYEHLAYVETPLGSQLISDADQVSILAQKYAMLRTQALTPEETRDLLDSLLGES
ncbi:helix-turn-helix transcriptional regulator [Streptomyces sp. RK75]|uniref:helix-turn-helix domain-containing protein n=1 Tax=Streptomyces sp. RK75 TaxID=2824895 RepID=UPI001FFDEB84|nr:helix-turn-helix transcriptional regulator [Streptomyces sp. RK75]